MEVAEVRTLLQDLSGNIDDLESSLEPLLKASLSTITSRLPLLDKAKLYVLTTYAIESILFSYLRLNSVDAKEHAVFRELTRVKEYFDKIKVAEEGPAKRPTTLDAGAAARFVKQGLSGNARHDQERRAREQGAVKRRADELEQTSQWGSHNRFEGAAKRMRAQEPMVTVVKASEGDDDSEVSPAKPQVSLSKEQRKAVKQQHRMEARLAKQSSPTGIDQHDPPKPSASYETQPLPDDSSRADRSTKKKPTRREKRQQAGKPRARDML